MKQSFGEKLKALFSKGNSINEDFFEELTDMLVEGDIGAKTAFEIVDQLESICNKEKIRDQEGIIAKLKELLLADVKPLSLEPEKGRQNVWMMLGVNGVGKTTSAAKLAKYFKGRGVENIVLASADTFRAAAIEQLALHGERLGVRVVSHQHGSDPSAVVFDAADALRAAGPGLVIADTAGRLHNKENLVRELQKIGQNALRQAEVFNEAVKIDAIIMTKYDSTAKGGVAVSIGRELGLPVAFVCTGEGYDNIQTFDAQSYINDFLSM